MSAKLQVDKYFQALQRLIDRHEPISNDAVAIEARSGRGSIKKSRPAYAGLIAAIDKAALEQTQAKAEIDPAPGLQREKAELVRRLDQALERELALLNEVYKLREEVRQLRGQPFSKPLVLVNNNPHGPVDR